MTFADIIQAVISGLALGGNYALLALGMVIIYAATGILNFAQGLFLLLGAFLTYQMGQVWGLPFFLSVLLAMAFVAVVAVLVGSTLMKRFSQHNHLPAVLATVGLLFAGQAIIGGIFGEQAKTLGDPWGLQVAHFGGAVISVASLWTIAVSAVMLIAFFILLQRTPLGLAMRASVSDEEAAQTLGVNPQQISRLAWALGGTMGAVAGVFMATGSAGVNSTLATVAFAALPAMVLGGIASPVGALVGGVAMGLIQQFAALLQPTALSALGGGFPSVVPYFVLIIVLIFRPQGLFGRAQVVRF